ncbi:hypothetical protein SLEP1_g38491 [Rubroshorea leprosula]|nr:hypothetical protein SLEP1_g38491 [Rubroshorea leprosula]
MLFVGNLEEFTDVNLSHVGKLITEQTYTDTTITDIILVENVFYRQDPLCFPTWLLLGDAVNSSSDRG